MHVQRGRVLIAAGCLVLAVIAGGCDTSDPFASAGGSASAAASAAASASATASISATSPAASTSVTAAPRSPAATARPAATPKPIASLRGSGFTDSKTFRLDAGTYVVRWTVTSKDAGGCSVIAALHTPDGKISRDIASATLAGKGAKSGARTITKLPAGTYVVTFATTCSWTATVYPG